MSNKTLRIASIANELFLSESLREAGILDDAWNFITRKKPRLKKDLTSSAIELSKYLHGPSNKIDFIKSKLGIYRNINSVIKALEFLLENIKNIEEPDRINQVKDFIKLIEEAKTLLDKREDKKEKDLLGKNLAEILLSGKLATASSIVATTEPLDEDDNSIEDGVTSHPLEEGEEDLS